MNQQKEENDRWNDIMINAYKIDVAKLGLPG